MEKTCLAKDFHKAHTPWQMRNLELVIWLDDVSFWTSRSTPKTRPWCERNLHAMERLIWFIYFMDQFPVGSVVWASARGDIFWPGQVSFQCDYLFFFVCHRCWLVVHCIRTIDEQLLFVDRPKYRSSSKLPCNKTYKLEFWLKLGNQTEICLVKRKKLFGLSALDFRPTSYNSVLTCKNVTKRAMVYFSLHSKEHS